MHQTLSTPGRQGVWTEVKSPTSTQGYAVDVWYIGPAPVVLDAWDFSGASREVNPLITFPVHSGESRSTAPHAPEIKLGESGTGSAGPYFSCLGEQGLLPNFASALALAVPDEPEKKQGAIAGYHLRLLRWFKDWKVTGAGRSTGNLRLAAFEPFALEAIQRCAIRLLTKHIGWKRYIGYFEGLLNAESGCSSSASSFEPGSEFAEAVAKRRLPQLESAHSPAERRQLFRILTRFSSPEAVVQTAFEEYDRTGREAFLLHAVSLLAAFKTWAWPSLLWVAKSGRPEAELFLGLFARCGVSKEQLSDAFRLIGRHGAPSVRLGLLEHLAALPLEEEKAILRELAANDTDDSVKAEAADRLSALPASVQ